jgi:hypothetical protein
MSHTICRTAALVVLWLAAVSVARAHFGPPFPVIQDQESGPYNISVWAHPDIGTSAFYVILEPAPGTRAPEQNDVRIFVQPVDGRLPEVGYQAERDAGPNQMRYDAQVEFDQRDLWRVRVTASGANGKGEVQTQVESTPTFGPWDLLFYGFPFLLFGGLWLLVALRRARCGSRRAAVGAETTKRTEVAPSEVTQP